MEYPEVLRSLPLLLALPLLAACSEAVVESGHGNEPEGEEPVCTGLAAVADLPAELPEASGVARDPRRDDLLWLHNDSGNDPVLFATDTTGRLVTSVGIVGASSRDPEDLAVAGCPEGWCLFYGDFGDNGAVRADLFIHRIPLPPEPTGSGTPADPVSPAATYWVRYPTGPRDAESLIVDADRGELIIVTKGREGMVDMYAADLETLETVDGPVALERIGRLDVPTTSEGSNSSVFVTAGDLSPDGTRLAIRSYSNLYMFDWEGSAAFDTLTSPRAHLLIQAGEPQGEGLAFGNDGETVYLASETRDGSPQQLSRLVCRP